MLSCQFEDASFLLIRCVNRFSFNSNECLLHHLKLIYLKLYLELYCSNIFMQRKPSRRGGEHWALLIPNATGGCLRPAVRHLVLVWRPEHTLAGRRGLLLAVKYIEMGAD